MLHVLTKETELNVQFLISFSRAFICSSVFVRTFCRLCNRIESSNKSWHEFRLYRQDSLHSHLDSCRFHILSVHLICMMCWYCLSASEVCVWKVKWSEQFHVIGIGFLYVCPFTMWFWKVSTLVSYYYYFYLICKVDSVRAASMWSCIYWNSDWALLTFKSFLKRQCFVLEPTEKKKIHFWWSVVDTRKGQYEDFGVQACFSVIKLECAVGQ